MTVEKGVSKKIINNLVIIIIVLTLLSTILTYSSIDNLKLVRAETDAVGKVSINVEDNKEVIASGKVGITIVNDSRGT